jgi:hypothetical protein
MNAANRMRVVNSHREDPGPDAVDITRRRAGMHFGNPFSHRPNTLAQVAVGSRTEAVSRYRTWLLGESDRELEPERREWILKCLPFLAGAVLSCRCKPAACHGDVLAELATRREA